MNRAKGIEGKGNEGKGEKRKTRKQDSLPKFLENKDLREIIRKIKT